jgi:ribosomal-protein-alanine N-acetyltransferase
MSGTLARLTPRLHLRSLRAADADAWIRAHQASAAEFDRWMPRSDPTVDYRRRFHLALARALDGERQQIAYTFVAEHRVDRELVAFCSLSQVFRGPFQNAYAGWRVSTPYVGQGIGREAVSAMLDVAFDEAMGLGLHRVQANVIPTNAPSLKLARAVGFREEGYAVKYLEIDGRYQDHVMFAKLAEEHGAMRA